MHTDWEQVVELMTYYGRAVDTRDYTLLRRAFTDDATFDYGGFGGEFAGFDAFESYLDQSVGPLDATEHLFGSFSVTFDGEEAELRCIAHTQLVRDGSTYAVGGTYRNTVTRTADGWRISAFSFAGTWTHGDATVLAHVEQ
jgi:hypothetical protein